MDWISFIKDVGFPIALVVYLMYERKVDRQSLEREKIELNRRMSELEAYIRTTFDEALKESAKAVTESTTAINRLEAWLERSYPSGGHPAPPNGTPQ